MYLSVKREFVKNLLENKFLIQKANEFKACCECGTEQEFLRNNPEFIDQMMRLADSDDIKIVEDESHA